MDIDTLMKMKIDANDPEDEDSHHPKICGKHGNMEINTIDEVMITDNIILNKHDDKAKAHQEANRILHNHDGAMKEITEKLKPKPKRRRRRTKTKNKSKEEASNVTDAEVYTILEEGVNTILHSPHSVMKNMANKNHNMLDTKYSAKLVNIETPKLI